MPNAVLTGPGGDLYVSLLPGCPFPEGAAKVVPVGRRGRLHDVATGLIMALDVAFGPADAPTRSPPPAA